MLKSTQPELLLLLPLLLLTVAVIGQDSEPDTPGSPTELMGRIQLRQNNASRKYEHVLQNS